MENIVISEKIFNGYFVKYPYGSHINFIATSYKALKDGLKHNKWNYKPEIFIIETWSKTPKFRKLTRIQLNNLYDEISKY